MDKCCERKSREKIMAMKIEYVALAKQKKNRT